MLSIAPILITFKLFSSYINFVEAKKQNADKTSIDIWQHYLYNVILHVDVRSRRVADATIHSQILNLSNPKNSLVMVYL